MGYTLAYRKLHTVTHWKIENCTSYQSQIANVHVCTTLSLIVINSLRSPLFYSSSLITWHALVFPVRCHVRIPLNANLLNQTEILSLWTWEYHIAVLFCARGSHCAMLGGHVGGGGGGTAGSQLSVPTIPGFKFCLAANRVNLSLLLYSSIFLCGSY